MPHQDYLMYSSWSQSWKIVKGTLKPDHTYGYIIQNGEMIHFSSLVEYHSYFCKVIVELNSLFRVIKYYKD